MYEKVAYKLDEKESVSIFAPATMVTNLLVLAVMLSAAMVAAVYKSRDVTVRAYMAPLLGWPMVDTKVEFIDVAPAIETVNSVASGINAWIMLDERLLSSEAIRNVSRSLSPKYGKDYNSVRSLFKKTSRYSMGPSGVARCQWCLSYYVTLTI